MPALHPVFKAFFMVLVTTFKACKVVALREIFNTDRTLLIEHLVR
jgi:hypothetical protein